MSTETVQTNPVQGGLSPEQQHQAVELRQTILNRDIQLVHTRGNMDSTSHTGMLSGNTAAGPSVISAWSGDIATGFRSQQLKSAERAAKRHYKKNEAAYQSQALQDATDAGVEIVGLPYETPKDSPKRRLGNAALALVDTATAVSMASTLVAPVAARDLIPSYLAYRFGKGAAVRGAAAVKGRGDTEMALAHHLPIPAPLAAHTSKKQLHAKRREANS